MFLTILYEFLTIRLIVITDFIKYFDIIRIKYKKSDNNNKKKRNFILFFAF